MNKIFTKYSTQNKKIILILLIIFSFFQHAHALDPISDGCYETEEYDIDKTNISWSDPYYLTTISKNYNFNLSIWYWAYDCEKYDDFFLEIPWLPLHLSCLWWRSKGNNKYRLAETWLLKNMVANTNYELYLTQNRNNKRGIWRIYLCYNKIPKEDKKTNNQNILVSEKWFFEKRSDYITFMQIQVWLWFVWLILIMLYKILYFRK